MIKACNFINRSISSNFGNKVQKELKKETHTQTSKSIKEPSSTPIKPKDPLIDSPLRMLGYANEVGEAIKDVCPPARLFSWIGASLYMGADIWDKYKKGDEETGQKPSIKKGVCEALFQALASCTFTIVAVDLGKDLASNLGQKFSKSGLTLDSEKELLGFVGQKMREGALNTENGAQEAILNPIKKMMNETKDMNPPIKLFHPQQAKNYSQICTIAGENLKNTAKMDPIKVEQFVNTTITEAKHIQKGLKTGTLASDAPVGLNQTFGKIKQKYFDTINHYHHEPDKENKAINEILQNQMKEKAFFKNCAICLGGLLALAICAKPIDYLTEKYIIKPLEHKWTQKEEEQKRHHHHNKLKVLS